MKSSAPDAALAFAPPPPVRRVAPPSGPPPALGAVWSLEGKAQDIATGAYVSLGSVGAVIRRKDNEILLVRLGEKISPLSDDGKLFSRLKTLVLDRGPDMTVYWVAEGKLSRRLVDREGKLGAVEELATDAEEGYPPQGVRDEGATTSRPEDMVVYVARRKSKDGERRARLWVEGKGLRDLSDEGSGASSVFLSALGPGRAGAVWMDGRSALAPIHAMPIDLDGAGEPRLGAEGVTWIAPPADQIASVSALAVDGVLVALLAVPKNGMDFGLAGVPVAFGAPPLLDPVWLDYPNGLDPAPVVPARFCGQAAILLVQPTAREASAPRAVQIATVEASGRVTPRLEVARAGRVDHLAAWVSPKGDGWAAWVGDGRTRVQKIRCGK